MADDLGKMMFPMPTDDAFIQGRKRAENYEVAINKVSDALDRVSDVMENIGNTEEKNTREAQTWGVSTVMWANKIVQAFKMIKKFATGLFDAISGAISSDISLGQTAFSFGMDAETLDTWRRTALALGESMQTVDGTFSKVDQILKNRSLWEMPNSKFYLAAQAMGFDNPEQTLFKMSTEDYTRAVMEMGEGLVASIGERATRTRMEALGVDGNMLRIAPEFDEMMAKTIAITEEQMLAQLEIQKSVQLVKNKWQELVREFLLVNKDAITQFLDSLVMLADLINFLFGKDSAIYASYRKLVEGKPKGGVSGPILENVTSAYGQENPLTTAIKALFAVSPAVHGADFGYGIGSGIKDFGYEQLTTDIMESIGSGLEKAILTIAPSAPQTVRVEGRAVITTPYGDADIMLTQVESNEG